MKKLGSLLGDIEDVMRRKNLASAAMNKLKAMWLSKKRISIDKKIKIYNALVKPVLTYNSSTWGLTKAELNKVDAFHRKHLRTIWKRRKMSNKQVYELSKTNKISEEIKKSRWRMFGHVLRLDLQTPAQMSMTYYFEEEVNMNKVNGRPRTTLATVLNNDLKEAKKVHNDMVLVKFENNYDLNRARILAADRKGWKKLSQLVCSIA